jgi:hypothetical protein
MQVLRFDDKLHDRDSLAKILTLSVMAADLVEALGCSPNGLEGPRECRTNVEESRLCYATAPKRVYCLLPLR